ncbi:MAG TPA: PAS domain S-box protein, partial [Pyrinomonadaceae bacterium]|nr:PAS domain S-box protein [Pyrinomonadaceae bacterium]
MKSTSQPRRRSNKKESDPSESHVAESQEDTVQVSDGSFRLAFENAPIGMAVIDFDFCFRRVNKPLCDALGYEAEELLGRKFVDITHPDDVERDLSLAARLFRREIPSYKIEKRFITKEGNIAWLEVTALVIRREDGEPLYGLAMVDNITQRKQAQEALRRSEERYRSFVVNSSEGIWRLEIEEPVDTRLPLNEQIRLLNKYAYMAECNDTMARIYGHQRADDIIGWHLNELAPDSIPPITDSIQQFIDSNYRLLNFASSRIDPQGETRYYFSTLIGIVINNMLLRIWGVQRDRTAQKTAELELERSHQQLRSLSAHLQSLRERERTDLARELHDALGQPLTSIKIDISLLQKKLSTATPGTLPTLNDKLNEITELLNETIASVKALSTELRPGVLDKFGLVAAMEWQCEEFSRRSGIECRCSVPVKELPLATEVSTALFRVLQEALTNVVRHSQADQVKVELTADDSTVSLTVADNGTGITEQQLRSPTSLGLLGMRERVEFLGGTLSIEGKQDHGTTVRVSTPLKLKEAE